MKKILVSLLLLSFTFHLAMAQSSEKTPLYILDGKIVASISDIAPNDIEKVSVLKGAMATKKYGEKAADGVVEITSKKNAKKEGTKNATKDSTKVTVTIDGNKNAKVKTDVDVNMTVVVDGNKVTINGKEVDENDPRLQIEGKNNKRIILKKIDKNLNGLGNLENKKAKVIIEGKRMNDQDSSKNLELSDDIIINEDVEDDFDLIEPQQNKINEAFLGVVTEAIEEGAKVNKVSEPSPAAIAGLKEGDIITKVNDLKIDGPAALYDAIGKSKPEDKVTISFIRNGKTNTVVASLAKNKNTMQYYNFSSPEGQGGFFDLTPKQYFDPNTRKLQPSPRGFSFAIPNFPGREGMTIPGFENKPKLGISIEDIEDGKGVKIKAIQEGSPAQKAGLKIGDIITNIDKVEVKEVNDIKWQYFEVGQTIKVIVLRDKAPKTIEVKIPKKINTADL